MAEKKKSEGTEFGPPEVNWEKTAQVLQVEIDTLKKENAKLKKDVLAEIEKAGNIRKEHDRNQRKVAKKTQWNPWELVHCSEDGKDRTEIINCGSRSVVIHRVVNGLATCVYLPDKKYRCIENSDGSYKNTFT